jgi:hypothetical protein
MYYVSSKSARCIYIGAPTSYGFRGILVPRAARRPRGAGLWGTVVFLQIEPLTQKNSTYDEHL